MINVLYCLDKEGFLGFQASLYSLLTHTKSVNIYVFSMTYHRDEIDHIRVFEGITPQQEEAAKQIVQYLDPKGSKICFYDTLEEYHKYFVHGVDENDGHSSPYAPLRLLVDVILPHVPHILYIDCDTIIQRDLTPMYYYYLDEINLTNDCAYAAFTNRLDDGSGEMVAGVLVFDMQKAKALDLFEKTRYNITHKKHKWYDQSALEESGKYVELAETFNYMQPYDERIYEPAILHFADKLGPKIYHNTVLFFKRYPQFEYIREGCKLIDEIQLRIAYRPDNIPVKGRTNK